MKNYVAYFITDGYEKIDAQQAASITIAWSEGAKFVMINGNIYATHQIKSIKRIPRSEEKDMLIGLSEEEIKKALAENGITKFLPSNQNLLT